MKIDIHRIPSEGLKLEFLRNPKKFHSLKKLIENDECKFAAPLSIFMDIIPMRDFIQVKGIFTTTFLLICARCLASFEKFCEGHFTLNYSRKIPKELHHDDSEVIELTAEKIGMIYFAGEEIDFTDAIQEQVVLSIPFKALCKNECRGLCIKCGQDLNQDICQCDRQISDGPFAVLKNLNLLVKEK